MAWRPAACLPVFHAQLKAYAPRSKPPATPVNAWGTVGDLTHQTGTSDHNPNDFPGWGNDIVTAADWPHAPALGLDAGAVAETLRQSRDVRIRYVIFGGQIFSNHPVDGYPAWAWRPHGGTDKHLDHGHLSVVGDRRADDTRPWAMPAGRTESQGGAMVTYEQYDRDRVNATLGAATRIEAAIATLDAQLKAVASKADISPEELAAIADAARQGATSGAGAQAIAEAVVALLPGDDNELTRADVEAAIRRVFGGLDGEGPAGA